MTKLRRKLLLSVLTLALTFIALGSTTFAWFTIGTQVTANAFGGDVQSGEGIEVCFVDGYNESADQNTWKNQNWVTSFNIADAINSNPLYDLRNLKFKDLTSTDGIAINELAGTSATANTDYVELTMYVRALPGTNKQVGDIKLQNVVGAASPEFDWYPDATITGTSNDFTKQAAERWNALNALRASFTAEDKANNEHTEIIEFALTGTDHGSADATATGTAYKYAEAKKRSDITAKENNNDLPTGNNVIDSLTNDGRKGNGNFADDLDLKLNDTNVVAYDSYTDNGKTYYIYKITLRVWMEGWDGDCIDAIFGKSVNFGFILSATFDPAA